MSAGGWSPALVSKMAADIFEHYDTDGDGLLKHKVPPPHEPRNPALIWGGVGSGWGGAACRPGRSAADAGPGGAGL